MCYTGKMPLCPLSLELLDGNTYLTYCLSFSDGVPSDALEATKNASNAGQFTARGEGNCGSVCMQSRASSPLEPFLAIIQVIRVKDYCASKVWAG